jgi:hypothetical protein
MKPSIITHHIKANMENDLFLGETREHCTEAILCFTWLCTSFGEGKKIDGTDRIAILLQIIVKKWL